MPIKQATLCKQETTGASGTKVRASGGPLLYRGDRIGHIGACEPSRERVRHLVAKRGHEHDVWFGHTMRSDHGDRQALRSSDATPHAHQRELYVRGSLWQRARHRIGQAHCVSERRKPQIKHAITNKEVEFHGNNDTNVVIIATGDVCHEDLDCSLVDPFNHFSIYPKEYSMTKLALFVRLEAKPGQEAALADFLASALPLANAESGTTAWFALKFGPSTFGVFDAFADEAGRQAHLNGQIAAALMANAATLLSSPPNIEKVELLAAKLPA